LVYPYTISAIEGVSSKFTPGKLNTQAFHRRLDEPGGRAGRKILVTTLFRPPLFEIKAVVRYGNVHDVSDGG